MISFTKIGLIAGGGQFPLLFAKAAEQKGYQVHAAAYVNEAAKEIQEHVTSVEWLHLGQVGRLVKFFKKLNITEAVMLGTVQKTRIFTDIKPDLKAMAFIAKMGHTHDDSVLTLFANLLEKEGVLIKPSTFLLPELISQKGCWTKRKPGKTEKKDIAAGWRIAKAIGRLDIGQCIVLGNGTVLAVEAADGTDATIRRGGALAKTGSVVVKLSKPGQDLRFDLPSSGLETIKTMHESGASLLVLEAGKSIAFDRSEMIALADQHKISIVAMDDDEF
ncbi:MAG: UDP-2,3-diacylglucosamine diphosphatase LpxI [Thermodesulfobacteriota bacterium]|nr:UDP-2,3-diacylglucosamine diphosphatase LpxI [Thermodesulfobacteriota bacterium]